MSEYFNFNQGPRPESRTSKLRKIRSKINKKILFIAAISLAIPITIFLSQNEQDIRQFASEKKKSAEREKPLPPKGYIVELKSVPATSGISSDLSRTGEGLRGSFQSSRSNLLKEHQSAKTDILGKLGKRSFDNFKLKAGDKKVKILAEFTDSFNGLAIDADPSEIEKIKTSPFVKAVYPNNSVRASLMDSVPLVKSDWVWQNVKDSTGSFVTGKGVNIAILDTGVDYSHPDLGNSKREERNFQKITPSYSFINYENNDLTFSHNQNRIAYASDSDEISIYSFETEQITKIPLGTTDIPEPTVYNLLLEGDYLFYVSLSYKAVNLYIKNLTTGETKKISDLGLIKESDGGGIASVSKYVYSNGRLYYDRQSGLDADRVILRSVYYYDVATGEEVKILPDSFDMRFPKVWGNKLVYSVYNHETHSYEKNVLRDLDTGEEVDISFTGIGPAIDFNDNLILSKSYGSWGTYHLYNIETGQLKKISYETSLESGSISEEFEYTITLGFNLDKGMIGDGVVFFQRNYMSNQLIAYDLISNKYSLLNLKIPASAVDGEGKKVCFASRFNYQIYCHDYDSSYAYPLPDESYNAKVKGGYNFIDFAMDGLDDNGHGTHVAGIAAGNGNVLKGVAPDANIYAYKVLSSYGSGYIGDIIWAIDTAIQTRFDTDSTNDIDVINLSLGGTCYEEYTASCGPEDPLSKAVNNAADAGIVVVVAAGNGGVWEDLISTPGTASKAITVGAVDKQKKMAEFSSIGPVIFNGEDLKKPDVVAPGVSICSSELFGLALYLKCFDSVHATLQGTSMATPHVAGLAALVLQAHPDWTPEKVKTAIKNSALNLGYSYDKQGAGLIDAKKLFESNPVVIPTPTPTSAPPPSPTPTIVGKITKLTPTADSYVKKEKPNANFGTGNYLQTESLPGTISFMKFNLSSLAGKKIIKATLAIKVNDASDATQALKKSNNTNWTEKGINFNNRPSLDAPIATFIASSNNKTIELDVTEIVKDKKGRSLTLGITSSGGNDAKYYSRNSSVSNRPQLVIQHQ